MKNILVLFAISLLPCSAVLAKKKKHYLQDIYIGAGSLTEYAGQYRVNKSNHTENFNFTPYFNIGMHNFVYKKIISFRPEFGLTLPHSAKDNNISRLTANLLGKASFHYKKFAGNIGLGLNWVRLSGDGGTQNLSNGDSFTDFPMPESSSTSQNLIVTLGFNQLLTKEIGLFGDLHILNASDSLSRAYNYIIGINYHFGKVRLKL